MLLTNNWHNSIDVVFSDESYFEPGTYGRWLMRKIDEYSEKVCFEKVAHPKKILIWGVIGKNFRSKLVIIEHSVTFKSGEIILGSNAIAEADYVYGVNGWVLQQDNARPHV